MIHVRRAVTAAIATAVTAAAAVVAPVPSAQAATPTTVLFGTHNTLHGKSKYTAFASVIGWQELDTTAAQNRMKKSLPGYSHCIPKGVAGEDSISWKSSLFTAGYCGARLTHKGQAGVTPNRYVVYQLLKIKKTGLRFAFVNTHFISGAFSGHPERQGRWNTHLKVLQKLVAELRAKKIPVVVVGDFNRGKLVSLPGLRHYSVTGVKGVPIDQMYATTGNKLGNGTRLAKNGSDHYAYRAKVRV